MDEIEETKATTPLVKATAAPIPADSFSNKKHYEGGHIFNFPVSYYEQRTEAEMRQWLLDGGNDETQVTKDMGLIREGLRFHETDFKKPEAEKKA